MNQKKILQMNTVKKHDGFVLLFAVVVSAVIFFIGAGIFSIAYKELLISSLAQDSQKSIFAADSGIECALQAYQDGVFDDESISSSYNCFGEAIISERPGSFRIAFPQNGTCARVSITNETEKTIFFAQGYNKCDTDAYPVNFPGLVERVYRVSI